MKIFVFITKLFQIFFLNVPFQNSVSYKKKNVLPFIFVLINNNILFFEIKIEIKNDDGKKKILRKSQRFSMILFN